MRGELMLEGEEIDLLKRRSVVRELPDDLINEKYVRGEVRIVTEQARYPLSSIPQLLGSGDYLLRPEYQRRRRWSTEKKSRLIESLVMNVPVPPIFLYEYDYSKYEVMDGLQRLSTIRDFYADAFSLQGLVEWEELNGRTYSSLPTSVRAGIDRRYLSSIILLQETARNDTEARILKQLVFERINSGGEKLTPQETRNAVHGGPMNDLCLTLSRHPSLCLTWGIPVGSQGEAGDPDDEEDAELLENDAYREMFDVELVLRFFAFRQDPQYMAKSLRDYFDEYLKRANRFDPALLSQLGDLFKTTIDLVYEVFGERAFWLWRQRNGRWNWLSRPTTVAYDTIMFAFSQRLPQKDLILEHKEELAAKLPSFYEENYSSFAGRYTNPANIISRRELFGDFVDGELRNDRR
ncbi:uncharacterized protein DUF262 [Micromonospora palomenae]|uniref:Uncharacterized protein DUF262 n=2 Tax=Micromonospora palomenae TaxID=1461247 RepID=A0A561WEC1_9ACTN|nr:uncharacterized protein DUF262 [Micromonospora palomenae]